MKKAYLLVYSDSFGDRELLKIWANSSPLVKTWRYDLPNCFYLISESSADAISANLKGALGKNGRFLLTEISENREGLLPKESWYMLTHKNLESELASATRS